MAGSYDKVSIIVPVYNVEKYLPSCVQSLLNQTYRNIQIILVDDGSTDQSGFLCNKYQKLDDRVTVIHQENHGLSSARNAGMDLAIGDWIIFVDSDDVVSSFYVERLVKAAVENDAGLATCRFSLFSEIIPQETDKNSRVDIVDGQTAAIEILSDGRVSTSAWGKLARNSLWKSNPFPEGRKFEDLPVTWKLAQQANKVCLLYDKLYYYRKRPGSISDCNGASEQTIRDYTESIVQMVNEVSSCRYAKKMQHSAWFRRALECCRLWEMCSELNNYQLKTLADQTEQWCLWTVRKSVVSALLDTAAPLMQRMRIVLFAINPKFAIFIRQHFARVQ